MYSFCSEPWFWSIIAPTWWQFIYFSSVISFYLSRSIPDYRGRWTQRIQSGWTLVRNKDPHRWFDYSFCFNLNSCLVSFTSYHKRRLNQANFWKYLVVFVIRSEYLDRSWISRTLKLSCCCWFFSFWILYKYFAYVK